MMRHVLYAAAAAALLTFAATPVMAQPTAKATRSDEPAASAAATPDTPAPSAAGAGSDVSVVTGMSVKDKTGATIGQVSDVKTDAGRTTATIKMGADVFAVETNRLAVADGAATINATQAEIKGMLKK